MLIKVLEINGNGDKGSVPDVSYDKVMVLATLKIKNVCNQNVNATFLFTFKGDVTTNFVNPTFIASMLEDQVNQAKEGAL